VFQPGAYYLDITSGTDVVSVPGHGDSFGTFACICVGSCPTSIRVPVDVERTSNGFVARAVHGTLLVTLSINGIAAGGTMRGAASDG
jgi:hypothetical protein